MAYDEFKIVLVGQYPTLTREGGTTELEDAVNAAGAEGWQFVRLEE